MTTPQAASDALEMPERVILHKVSIPNVGTMLSFEEPINPDASFVTGEYALLTAAAQPASEHPDDIAVDKFALAMKAKLKAKRSEGSGGWETPECTEEYLQILISEHIQKGDPVDVGNIAMMLFNRGERTGLVDSPVSINCDRRYFPNAGKVQFKKAQPATDTTGEGHCKDCCCAKSWEALGVKEYTGKSIPEHITELKSALLSKPAAVPEGVSVADYEEALANHRKMVRDLDVALNGEDGAAEQAALCDLVVQAETFKREQGYPALLVPSDEEPFPWFINDGDEFGLREFIDNLEWDYFVKGGKDRNGHFLVFLKNGDDDTIAAIKSISNKRHLITLDALKAAPPPNDERGG